MVMVRIKLSVNGFDPIHDTYVGMMLVYLISKNVYFGEVD